MIRTLLTLAAVLVLADARPSAASEAEIRAAIEGWYAALRMGDRRRIWPLIAPEGVVRESCRCPERFGPRSRAAQPDPVPYRHFLAVRSQVFRPEIEIIVVGGSLAKARVWERGYIYAWAAGTTYENAASATFVFERRPGEPWKILLYSSQSQAIRPKDVGAPMPDLSPPP